MDAALVELDRLAALPRRGREGETPVEPRGREGETPVEPRGREGESPRTHDTWVPPQRSSFTPRGSANDLPPGAVALHRDLLRVLWERPAGITPPDMTPDRAQSALAAGEPLLRVAPAAVDGDAVRWRARQVVRALARHQPGGAIQAIAGAVRRGAADFAVLACETLRRHPPEAMRLLRDQSATLGLDPGMVGSILRLALFPAMAEVASSLARRVETGEWQAGSCPVCGSWPMLGEQRGLVQTRVLRCALCATGWHAERLRCSTCGERDHAALGYFAPEGEEMAWRIVTCDSCRAYLKILSTLIPITAPGLLVADLATLPLDVIARGRGYAPPS